MSVCNDVFYVPLKVNEMSAMISNLPLFYKCRILGFLEIDSSFFILKDFLETWRQSSIKVIFNENVKIPPLEAPEPVEIFGEVVHLSYKEKQDSYLRSIFIQKLPPTLLNPLSNIINDVKTLKFG